MAGFLLVIVLDLSFSDYGVQEWTEEGGLERDVGLEGAAISLNPVSIHILSDGVVLALQNKTEAANISNKETQIKASPESEKISERINQFIIPYPHTLIYPIILQIIKLYNHKMVIGLNHPDFQHRMEDLIEDVSLNCTGIRVPLFPLGP